MPFLLRLHWIMFIPVRVVLWPYIWYDLRQRRLGKRPDEWCSLERFLWSNNHVIRTFGYFFWEKKAKICWWCLVLWVSLILWAFGSGWHYWGPYAGLSSQFDPETVTLLIIAVAAPLVGFLFTILMFKILEKPKK